LVATAFEVCFLLVTIPLTSSIVGTFDYNQNDRGKKRMEKEHHQKIFGMKNPGFLRNAEVPETLMICDTTLQIIQLR